MIRSFPAWQQGLGLQWDMSGSEKQIKTPNPQKLEGLRPLSRISTDSLFLCRFIVMTFLRISTRRSALTEPTALLSLFSVASEVNVLESYNGYIYLDDLSSTDRNTLCCKDVK